MQRQVSFTVTDETVKLKWILGLLEFKIDFYMIFFSLQNNGG